MMGDPASIRYNNPGAMWGGNAVSRKWGERGNVSLNDGTGQGNKIAVFPTKVRGAAAQFDLWRGKNYRNKRLADAIRTWSGGNWSAQYVAFLTARVPGLTPDTIIDDAFLSSASGLAMMKAQAWHEAGKPYPMTDAEWREAQALVFSGKPPVSVTVKKVVKGAATVAPPVVAGFAWPDLIPHLAAAAVIVVAIVLIRKFKK